MVKGTRRVSWVAASLLVALTALSVSVSHAQAPKDILSAAQNAMGSTLLGNMQFTATGRIYSDGNSTAADTSRSPSERSRYKLEIDYMIPAMRLDLERANRGGSGARSGGPPPERQIQSARGTVAWNMSNLSGTDAVTAPMGDRLVRIWTSPHGVIKAAHRAGAELKVTTERGGDGKDVTVLTFPAAGSTVKAWLDGANLVTRVETRSDDPARTATTLEIVYSGYKDAKQIGAKPLHPEDLTGVVFPTRIVATRDGRPLADLTVTSARPNAYMVFPVPTTVKAAAAGSGSQE